MSTIPCKWCKERYFTTDKLIKLVTSGGSIYWVCSKCIKVGRIAAKKRRQAEKA